VRRYEGTRVFLTGAGSGIGRATAVRLVGEGATVFAVDRDAESLASLAAAIAFAGSADGPCLNGVEFRLDGGSHV